MYDGKEAFIYQSKQKQFFSLAKIGYLHSGKVSQEKGSFDEIRQWLLKGQELAYEKGITSVISDDFFDFKENYEQVFRMLMNLAYERKLSLDVYEDVHIQELKEYERFLENGHSFGESLASFHISALKLVVDEKSVKEELLEYCKVSNRYNMPIHIYLENQVDLALEVLKGSLYENNPLGTKVISNYDLSSKQSQSFKELNITIEPFQQKEVEKNVRVGDVADCMLINKKKEVLCTIKAGKVVYRK
ncbi:hypothetical protein [Bulleidia sp. zg-1006]|uniref:hypothetical protein n=1 Tax=Bulleidia sp. zg-1006 TaxID=2806552 RepID=UPI001939EF3B|nr:hypothetical protein [Bulleidia sp. zg-1006]QRG87085.1 hypothetical protein JOS54_01900 [Bulleidia sp. zg-1006]